MTVLVGTIYKGKAYVGTDSLWTWGDNFVKESKTSKFVDMTNKNILIATAGQDKFTQILEVLMESHSDFTIESRKDVRELSSMILKEAEKNGVGEADNNELPIHDFEFLIASKDSDRLWTIDCDYSVQEFDDYACLGSGGFLSEAAMKALAAAKVFGKRAVQIAVETACSLHPHCGGKVNIRTIILRKSVSKAS